MFTDPTLVGCSWQQLTSRLDAADTVPRWAAAESHLAGLRTCDDLVAAWSRPDRTDDVLWALTHRAGVDAGHDDDALLVLLHLLSGVVWTLVSQLADLDHDVQAIVLAELTCAIRTFKWRSWTKSVAHTVAWQTRRGVLDDLLQRDRRHVAGPEVAWDGKWLDARPAATLAVDGADLDVVDVLLWAAGRGVDRADLELLLASERTRGRWGAAADERFSAERGICRRTLLRRRARALETLRELAPAYLAAVA